MLLPFTPPAGWVQLPQRAIQTQTRNVWKGPALPDGKRASFATMLMPFPGAANSLAAVEKAGSSTVGMHVISNAPVTVCGSAGRLVVLSAGAGSNAQIIEQQFLTKNSYGYMAVYSRPQGTPADPAIRNTMHRFCAGGTASLPNLPVPPHWTAGMNSAGMESLGMWMGTQPGQMMTLMRTPQVKNLRVLASRMRRTGGDPDVKKYLTVKAERNAKLCGNPATFVTLDINVPAYPMQMEQVATQANGVAYVLAYMHPKSQPPDAAADAALNTLCASPSPPALPSPTALPSPMPSASPLPRASPSPHPAATHGVARTRA